MSQPTYIVTTDQPTTVVVSPDQVVASVPANVQGPAGPAGPAPAGTGLVRVTDGVASTLTHPSPSPAGTFNLATLTIDAFGRVTAASNGTVTAATITDSTAVGRAVLTAADAAAARSAIGAGTGNGNALTSGTLAQFAATTSAELAGVLTDETGSGSAVFATSPTLTTPVVSGTLTVRQTGGTPGTNEGQIGHVTAGSYFQPQTGKLYLGTYTNLVLNSVLGAFSSPEAAFVSGVGWQMRSGYLYGWPSGSNPEASAVLALARLDDNTVEINNGTRTASGGALRGLSVSTLTASGAAIFRGTATVDATLGYGNVRCSGSTNPRLILDGGATGQVTQLDNASGTFRILSASSALVTVSSTGNLTAFGNLSTNGNLTANGMTTLGTYTVATLPSASANAGAFAQVTDSSSTTNGNTVAGGGANRVPVFSNGTNWIIK